MNKYRLTYRTPIGYIENLLLMEPKVECVYSVHTCWWSLFKITWMPYRSEQLPCDPLGSVLFQAPLLDFWNTAKEKSDYYGRHGINALMAAFHGNVESFHSVKKLWLPTAFKGWDEYNRLLDEFETSN